VIVSPALTEAVAQALANRLDQGFDGATIILDADPEVYRLGFGTEAGFDLLSAAAMRNLLDLRVQQGVRIGVVIADDITMVFSPVPLLIEAGSTSVDKPTALLLAGTAVERVAEAAGAGSADAAERHEIGRTALTPGVADALKGDLKNNPPQRFDVARALRVFTSKIQYVEIEVENYRLSSRQVRMPEELLDITDDQLRDRISGRLRAPTEALGPFEILIETKEGKAVVKADERWVGRERKRKRIEDEYTYWLESDTWCLRRDATGGPCAVAAPMPAGRRSECLWRWIADPGTRRASARIAPWRMLIGADSTCG
jgi:hypothetical protein